MSKLHEYLKANNITVSAFAASVNTDQRVVYHWLNGEKIPRQEYMQRIYELTGGAVTANDFYGIETPAPQANPNSLTHASNGVY